MKQGTITVLSIALFVVALLFGTYSLLYYLGMPVHVAVLVENSAEAMVRGACDPSGFLCHGWHALPRFVAFTIARSAPFLPYFLSSIVLYGAFIGSRMVRGRGWRLQIHLGPFHILLLGILSVWLIHTTLGFGTSDGVPIRRIFEPTPEVYVGAGEESLETLRNNFHRLQESGCLHRIGQTRVGAGAYNVSGFCMQISFLTRVLPFIALVIVFLFEMLILGQRMLDWLKLRFTSMLADMIVAIGVGVFLWIAVLWFVAVLSAWISLPLLVPSVGWSLLILAPMLCVSQARAWIVRFWKHRIPIDLHPAHITVVLGWLLLSYLALNFLNVIRPFPIGWDDLGSYLNRPRLLVSFGHFIATISRFEWEYLTALGFLLFGYDSTLGTTAAMIINWSEGLLAVLVIFLFARTYLGPRSGLLSALLYYSLPLVGHFSFADMKVDNAVFFVGALSMYMIFIALFPSKETLPGNSEIQDPNAAAPIPTYRLLFVAGIFAGLTFSLKLTGAMVAAVGIAALFAASLDGWGFLAAVAFVFSLFINRGIITMSAIWSRLGFEGHAFTRQATTIFLMLTGVAIFLIGFFVHARLRDRFLWKAFALSLLAFLGGIAASIGPWILHNNFQRGQMIPHFTLSAPDRFTPTINLTNEEVPDEGQPIRSLPPELALDPNHSHCKSTSHQEEVDRYWGNRHGIGHYLTLPWRTVMNLDSAGYYVTTMPALLLLPLLLLLPAFWSRQNRWMRWMMLLTGLLLLEWMFMSNGIPWYGIGILLGATVLLETLIVHAPDPFSRGLLSFFIACSLLSNFGHRFWQFENQRNLFEYSMGKVSAEVLEERTIPYYDDIRDVVLERNRTMPDRPYVYRMGTFIPYFIPRNLEVIGLADQQLDAFNCLYQERDPTLTLRRLRALGFNSMIFDTNTPTIEHNPQGSLHQKVNAFLEFVNDPASGLQVVVNDLSAGIAYILIP